MGWGGSLLLALAVSIDGFSAGFSCGIRRLTIPFTSLMVISLLSTGAIALSMLAGSVLAQLVALRSITALGGAVLILFGLLVVVQFYREKREKGPSLDGFSGKSPDRQQRPRGKFFSLLQRPEEADLDSSGVLSAGEALLLGSALAADAFAAGFGAALIGLPLLPTMLSVGLTKLFLLPLGAALGRAAAQKVAPQFLPLLGGAILIFIGIMNLL